MSAPTFRRKNIFARPSGSSKSVYSSARTSRKMDYRNKMRVLYKRPATSNKFIDLAAANYEASTTGSVTLIYTIPQGTNQSERIGKKIKIKNIQIRGQLVVGSAQVNAAIAVGYLIFDKQPTGSLPAITDIFDSIGIASHLNDDNTDRFVVLKKHRYATFGDSNTPTTASSLAIYDVDDFIKMNHTVNYKSLGTGAIADFSYGAVYWVVFGEEAAGTTAPRFTVSFRTRYEDIQG